jgi:hypothetical protein
MRHLIKTTYVWTILLASVARCISQGFINLDFESANLGAVTTGQSGGYVSVTNAIPGWMAFIGTDQQTQILQNNGSVGPASISIWGPNAPSSSIIQGNYSVFLTAGISDFSVSISQTGLVPLSAATLLFEAEPNYQGSGTFLVSMGGQNIPYFALATGPNYTLYGGDISAFSGLTETLTFSNSRIGSNFSYEELDNILFSSLPVPEPGAFGFLTLGGMLLAWRRLKL